MQPVVLWYTPKAVVIDNHLPRQPLISSYVPDWPLLPRVYIPLESEMALRARIYAYNRHLSFDVAFICSTLTHCSVCHLSVWRLKWEVSYVHQSVWRWKWFFCQSNYVLQRQNIRYCFPTGNRFTAAVGLWNMLWWYSFPTAKECMLWLPEEVLWILLLWYLLCCFSSICVRLGKQSPVQNIAQSQDFHSRRFHCQHLCNHTSYGSTLSTG